MQKIAIHGRQVTSDSLSHIESLFSYLDAHSVEVIISNSFNKANESQLDLTKYSIYSDALGQEDADCIFSLGGDGTLLDTITHVGDTLIPILGINTGRLGFLTTTAENSISESLDLLFTKQFRLEDRSLIQLETSLDLFDEKNFALNEFAILRKETSSMIVVKCYLNNEYLNTYWADGLMVSTPTGSTGYSLSCGGPVVLPQTKNFIITPVSPHNLNVRPLVIPDDGELTFKMESRETSVLISLDSRSATVPHDLEIKVKKADFNIQLIRLKGSSFLDTLRNKLGWGYDKRN
ncbi:MAG: NAD kinase [Cytophagales bacterium]|nr:NAD kinase [Cytophagales bacterium]